MVSTRMLAIPKYLAALILVLIVVHNLMKIPFYLPVGELPATSLTWDAERCPVNINNSNNSTNSSIFVTDDDVNRTVSSDVDIWCLGLESGAWLMPFGFRGVKLFTDPELFLAPHTIMGCMLLSMGIMAMFKDCSSKDHDDPDVEPGPSIFLSKMFFALSLVFATHIIPSREGIPGVTLNVVAISTVLVFSTLGLSISFLGHRLPENKALILIRVSWTMVMISCVTAAVLEAMAMIPALVQFGNTGEWPGAGENLMPAPNSGTGFYAACGCGWVGWLFSILLMIVALTAPCVLHYLPRFKGCANIFGDNDSFLHHSASDWGVQ